MELTLLTSKDEWKTVRQEWDELVENSFRPYPFLESWYLFNWWETLGGGEWPQETSTLQIITARESGHLTGIAPLFSSSKPDAQPALRFIGQIEATDYLDFISKPAKLENFLSNMLDFVDGNEQIPIKRLELANIQGGSPTIDLLKNHSLPKERNFEMRVLQSSPGIHLPSTWEEYLTMLSRKQRHEVRRKERNVERDFETQLVFADDPAAISEEMSRFIELMRNEETKAEFLTPQMEKYLIGLAKEAHKAGRLNLASLMLDGTQAATYLNFIKNNKLWVYNSGWNPNYAKASPGWVLLAKMIQWAIDHGLDEVDLLRGDEDYKYRFGAIDRQVVQIVSERK